MRPQNYFDELPWHARWDTARSLLNRVFTGDPAFPVGDFPGTLAVRRSAFLATGGYDGDALFENLELMRTIRAAGGTVATPARPLRRRGGRRARPTSSRSGCARPMTTSRSPPASAPSSPCCRWRLAPCGEAGSIASLAAALASIAIAEIGRRRAGGAERFPLSGSLLAPAWIAERSLCSWLALAAKLRGGVLYGGRRLGHSATSLRRLRRRHAGALDGHGGPARRPGTRSPCGCRRRRGGSVSARSGTAPPPAACSRSRSRPGRRSRRARGPGTARCGKG